MTGGTRVEDRPEFMNAVRMIEQKLKDDYEARFAVCFLSSFISLACTYPPSSIPLGTCMHLTHVCVSGSDPREGDVCQGKSGV